jgi:hypothetical protein
MQAMVVTAAALAMLGQADQTRALVASSGQTRLWVKTSPRPESSGTKLSLELCSGDSCSDFVCPGYSEHSVLQYFFFEAAPWPGHSNVALVEYLQSGTGSIPAFFKVTVSEGRARCRRREPPAPSKTLPDDEEQYWGVFDLHRDGRLEYRAGSYKKGRTDACRACRPDTVLRCSWNLTEAGFAANGCELSAPTE